MSDFKPNQPSAVVPPAQAAMNLEAFMAHQPGWHSAQAGSAPAIAKRWRFTDFASAMAFAQRVAALAESINHHPTLTVGWGVCTVRWSTHDAGGLTARDFDAARQTDLLDPGPDALPDASGASGASGTAKPPA